MTVLRNPAEARRVSLLTRVFQLGRRDVPAQTSDATESPATPPKSAAPLPTIGDRGRRSSPPEQRLYSEARRHIKRRAWGHAQRALEEARRREPDTPATLDLQSVRTIRRALHRLARWPSDVNAHLDLGRAYFDLDLGDDALAEFILVQRLAPRRYEGFALATLEYLYRSEYALAVGTWTRASELNPELPQLDEVIGTLPIR